jgi:glycosyltransferase involved in cell wall biosynthesis
MNVLLLSQYLALGGLERMMVSLARGLSREGVECCVVAYETAGVDARLVGELESSGVEIVLMQKRRGLCFRTLSRISKMARSRQIDIIHSHDLGALIYGAMVVVLSAFRIRLVHTQHSFVHFRKGKKRYALYERIFTAIAKKVCTVSEGLAETYRALGVNNRKLLTVPNGVSFAENFIERNRARNWLTQRMSSDLRASVEAVSRKRWIMALGRVVQGKGIERLLEMWSQLPTSLKESWRLMIVGPVDSTFFKHALEPLLFFGEDVPFSPIFAGQTAHPELWHFAADAFVSLSEQEGMPLAVCEALGAGLPVLISDIEGHRMIMPFATKIQGDADSLERFLRELGSATPYERINDWLHRDAFRRQFGIAGMVSKYKAVYHAAEGVIASAVRSLALVFLPLLLLSSSSIAHAQQSLTLDVERPEYLQSESYAEEFEIFVLPGETRLLTLRNDGFCGLLPKIVGATEAPKLKLQWYRGLSIPVRNPSYEGAKTGNYIDALIPVNGAIDCAPVAGAKVEWLFADLTIDEDSRPGETTFTIESAMHPSENDEPLPTQIRRWRFHLRVLPYRMSEPWALPLSAEFTPWFASLAHFGKSTEQEGPLTRAYVNSMVQHRVLPLKAWIKHPFKKQEEQLSGSFLLSRDPQPGMSYGETVVSELPRWASVDLPRIDSKEPDERLRYWSRWQEFLNGSAEDSKEAQLQKRMASKPFVYLWDEPTQEDLLSLSEAAESLRLGAPSVAALVTIYPWQSLLDSIQIFAPLLQVLEREGPPVLGPSNELWAYVSCMSHGCGNDRSSGEPDFVIERNASYIRVWPWIAEQHDLSRVLYYSVNNIWRKAKTTNVWEDVWDFSGNGDGTLYYPGRPGEHGLTAHVPVPSLRLKYWRQASFDAEYFLLAKKHHPNCFESVKEKFDLVVSATHWSRNSTDYDLARDELAACLLDAAESSGLVQP